MARPTKINPTGKQKKSKLTDETIRKLEEAFALDASILEACYYADISHDTYHRWIKEYPQLSDRFNRLREKPCLLARQSVIKAFKSDSNLALKYLERKKKEEFSLKTVNEHT